MIFKIKKYFQIEWALAVWLWKMTAFSFISRQIFNAFLHDDNQV